MTDEREMATEKGHRDECWSKKDDQDKGRLKKNEQSSSSICDKQNVRDREITMDCGEKN